MTRKMCKRGSAMTRGQAFSEFKDECLRQIERLGLKDWDIEIRYERMGEENEEDAAITRFTDNGRVAIITMNADWMPKDPRRLAKHEICHMLLGKISIIAASRFITEKELDDEIESLCTRLEKVL